MRSGVPLPSPAPRPVFDPEAEVLAMVDQTARLIAVTQTLISSQRHVDVQGLQDHVGLLCAKALDLPPSRTGFLKLELSRLASSLAVLHSTMRENAA